MSYCGNAIMCEINLRLGHVFRIAVRWSAPFSRGLMYPLEPSLCAASRCSNVLHVTALPLHRGAPICHLAGGTAAWPAPADNGKQHEPPWTCDVVSQHRGRCATLRCICGAKHRHPEHTASVQSRLRGVLRYIFWALVLGPSTCPPMLRAGDCTSSSVVGVSAVGSQDADHVAALAGQGPNVVFREPPLGLHAPHLFLWLAALELDIHCLMRLRYARDDANGLDPVGQTGGQQEEISACRGSGRAHAGGFR
eukprot:3803081-Amphidinium_carterae.4